MDAGGRGLLLGPGAGGAMALRYVAVPRFDRGDDILLSGRPVVEWPQTLFVFEVGWWMSYSKHVGD